MNTTSPGTAYSSTITSLTSAGTGPMVNPGGNPKPDQSISRGMPHIHVDFHEQYPNDHYYFAPALRLSFHTLPTGSLSSNTILAETMPATSTRRAGCTSPRSIRPLYPLATPIPPSTARDRHDLHEQAFTIALLYRAYELENGDTLTLLD